MELKCPKCSGKLKQVKTKSHYGKEILVDQCSTCGGLWFDPREYYQISEDEVKKLDSVNKKLLDTETLTEKDLFCPKDGNKMEKFKDPAIPKEIDIEICRKCGSYWFDRGELKMLNQHINRKDETSEEFIEGVDALLRAHSKKGRYEQIGNMTTYLMQPFYQIGGGKSNYPSQYSVGNALSSILRFLLGID